METTTTSVADRERGERLKNARLRAGHTLDSLGALVGTSRQHLIRLEKGIHRPKPDMLARIAEATDTPADELDPDSDDDEESARVNDHALRLYEALMSMLAEVVRNSNEPSGSLAEATLGSRPKGA